MMSESGLRESLARMHVLNDKDDKRDHKGYIASMVAEVTKTVLQALRADQPQCDRSGSRSQSTDRANCCFRRKLHYRMLLCVARNNQITLYVA